MKMVRAIVRPESTENVVEGLAASGFVALTKIQAFGRGKQKGLDSGSVHYDELPKNLLMMAVEDEHVVLDGNHRLAGQELTFAVTMVDVSEPGED